MHELVALLSFNQKSLIRLFNLGRQAFTLYTTFTGLDAKDLRIVYIQYYKLYNNFSSSYLLILTISKLPAFRYDAIRAAVSRTLLNAHHL